MKLKLSAFIVTCCADMIGAAPPFSAVTTQTSQNGYVEIVGVGRDELPAASVTMPPPDPRDPDRGLRLRANADIGGGASATDNYVNNRLSLECDNHGLAVTRTILFASVVITFDVLRTTSLNLHYHGGIFWQALESTTVGYTISIGIQGALPIAEDVVVSTAPGFEQFRPFLNQGLVVLQPGRYTFQLDTHIQGSGLSCLRADVGGLVVIKECRKDFNIDGFVDPDDISDFIACFFSVTHCDRADFNEDGQIDPDDISDFISQYFDQSYGDC